MKIITASSPWDITQLANTLKNKLNPAFQKSRQTDITFNIIEQGDTIEINQPEYYDGYLFRITAKGNELHVGKSEHYVDDINFITLQHIIENLQMGKEGGGDIIYISGE
jgi:hypothetical protein